jgi:glucokinase
VILAGDIGGTNARLALFDLEDRALVRSTTYPTAGWSGPEAVVGEFLNGQAAQVTSACLAVAGPVRHGRSERVNLPWIVDARELAHAFDVESFAVVNDLEANARGVPLLDGSDVAVVNRGESDPEGNRAVVSAGTGLGEAGLVRVGARYHAIAGEGGHTDFAPRSDVEVALYRCLAAEYGHVSYERVCSGSGLVNIYRFLRAADARRGRTARTQPTAAEITADASLDPDGIAARALRLFSSIYGARAANVALAFMATGGVYLGGGIAPRIVDSLTDGTFMRAFTAKGRLSWVLETIPVHVVLEDRTALLGAAEIAAARIGTRGASARVGRGN